MRFYAFELAGDDGSYSVHVHPNEETRDSQLRAILDSRDVETYALGVVESDSAEGAVSRILAGGWEYTQRD